VDKAGELLRVEVRHVPIDPATMQPDMAKFAAAIDKNTCMVKSFLFSCSASE
jgi:glutamate/tyrosine decarboxylase-like PLP-dependent enzyme